MKISLNSPPESLLKDKKEAECQDQCLLANGQQDVYSSYTPTPFSMRTAAARLAGNCRRAWRWVSFEQRLKARAVSEPYRPLAPIRRDLRRQQHCLVARVFRAQAGAGEFHVDIPDSGAIAWIMERYQVKTDKKSGIKNNPNDWAKEVVTLVTL